MTKSLIDAPQGSANNHHEEWLETDDESQARALIFQTKDRAEEVIPIPEWKIHVLVRGMSGTQRVVYEGVRDPETRRMNLHRAYSELVIMCCLHPKTKKPIFKEADRDALMNEKSGSVVDRIAMTALRLSNMLGAQTEAVKKSSEEVPTSIEHTNSPSD